MANKASINLTDRSDRILYVFFIMASVTCRPFVLLSLHPNG